MIDPALTRDRLRGALFGLAVGELLAAPAEGLDSDEIMRRYGRLVHLHADTAPGPITELASRLAAAITAGVRLADEHAPAELALVLVPVAIAARLDSGEAGRDAGEAGAIIATLAALAATLDPFAHWPARPTVGRVTAIRGDAILDRLRDQSRTALSPLAAASLFADCPAPSRLALEVAAALVARPHSSESAVVYATAMGGAATLRAALTAALVGVHRGAAALPSRWCEHLPAELTRATLTACERLR